MRWSASKAFLRPGDGAPNLTVLTGALVKKLRLEGRRALGVEFFQRRRGGLRRSAARDHPRRGRDRQPADPPALRHRAGRAAAAARHPGRARPAGVGENLQDHLQLRMAFKVKNVLTLNTHAPFLVGQGEDGARVRALPHRAADHGAVAAGRVREVRSRRRRRPTSSTTCSRCRSTSSASRCTASRRSPPACATCGRPRAATCASSRADPRAYPAIAPNYLSTPEDRRVAVDAMRLTRRIVTGTAGDEEVRARGIRAGARSSRRTTSWSKAARQRRHHHLPPGRHLQDGRGGRSARGGRPAAARARHRAPARDRRLDHADHHLRQHQLADGDDRGAGRGDDPGGPAVGALPALEVPHWHLK